jgi:hypothetical protein
MKSNSCYLLLDHCLLGLLFDPENGGSTFPIRLHGVTSQNTVIVNVQIIRIAKDGKQFFVVPALRQKKKNSLWKSHRVFNGLFLNQTDQSPAEMTSDCLRNCYAKRNIELFSIIFI